MRPGGSLTALRRPPNKTLRTNEPPFSAASCQSPPASGCAPESCGSAPEVLRAVKFGVSRGSARARGRAARCRAERSGAVRGRAGRAAPAAPAAAGERGPASNAAGVLPRRARGRRLRL